MDSGQFGRVMRSALQAIPKDLQPAGIVTFVDLFCGIGGFHYAGLSLGFQCVFASDIDSDACNQYEENFGIRPLGDVEQIKSEKIPDHDIFFLPGSRASPSASLGTGKAWRTLAEILFGKLFVSWNANNPRRLFWRTSSNSPLTRAARLSRRFTKPCLMLDIGLITRF